MPSELLRPAQSGLITGPSLSPSRTTWLGSPELRWPAGQPNGKAPGNRPKLNDDQRRALARIVEDGPVPAIHGVVRWRRKDLAQWIFEEFGVSVDEMTVGAS